MRTLKKYLCVERVKGFTRNRSLIGSQLIPNTLFLVFAIAPGIYAVSGILAKSTLRA